MKIFETQLTANNNLISFGAKLSREKDASNILFLGVTHGEEPQGEFLINKFIQESKGKIFHNNLYFIPCLNPDGKSKGKRGNSNNVDLNRNFKTTNFEVAIFDDGTVSGKFPQSEIETTFLANIIKKYNFDIVLSFHAPFEIVNFDGPAEKFAKRISEITGYPVQEDIGYATPGSFGTFCGVEGNIPTITLEVSENLSDDELWVQNREVFYYLANIILK